jgi:hypothetical protein
MVIETVPNVIQPGTLAVFVGSKYNVMNLSFPSLLPCPFLTCCAILPTSFGGKGTRLKVMIGRIALIDGLLLEIFGGFPQL